MPLLRFVAVVRSTLIMSVLPVVCQPRDFVYLHEIGTMDLCDFRLGRAGFPAQAKKGHWVEAIQVRVLCLLVVT